MSTLADPAVRAECKARVVRLNPDAPPEWGRMTARQMVCHLNDSFGVAMGQKYASPATNILQRTLVKWIALHTPVRWPPGATTRPEVEQGVGGTPPAKWENDCAELIRRLDEFANWRAFAAHPIFGKLSPEEWLTWGYRHVDHHLRQFGV